VEVIALTTLIQRMLYLSSEQALGGGKLRNNNLGNTTAAQVNPDFLETILAYTYNHKAKIT